MRFWGGRRGPGDLPGRCPRLGRDAGLASSTGVLAGVVVAALVVSTLLATGTPERLGCEIDEVVVSVTGGDATECAPAVELASGADTSAGTADGEAMGGLLAREFSRNDTVRPPATAVLPAATPRLPAGYERCAVAPNGQGVLCLAGTDEPPRGDAFTGNQVLVRCGADGSPAGNPDACVDTGTENAGIRTGPQDDGARWCQPVRTSKSNPASALYDIEWACASWAGDLFHCTSSTVLIGVATYDPVTGIGHPESPTWTQREDVRELWPTRCESRTFGVRDLDCDPPVSAAAFVRTCAVPPFQGLPERPATCVFFPPGPREDVEDSHLLGKPLHCRLIGAASAGSPRFSTTSTMCAVANTGRALLIPKRRHVLIDARCATPFQIPGDARPLILNAVPGRISSVLLAPLNRRSNNADLTVSEVGDRPRFTSAVEVTYNAAGALRLLLDSLAQLSFSFPTVFVVDPNVPPTGAWSPPGGENFATVEQGADPDNPESYRAIAWWVAKGLDLPRGRGGEPEGLASGVEGVLELVMAGSAGSTTTTRLVRPGVDAGALANAGFIQWVYSMLASGDGSPLSAAAAVITAAEASGETFTGFAEALPTAIAHISANNAFLTNHWETVLDQLQASTLWPTAPAEADEPKTHIQVDNPDGTICLARCINPNTGQTPTPTLTLRP